MTIAVSLEPGSVDRRVPRQEAGPRTAYAAVTLRASTIPPCRSTRVRTGVNPRPSPLLPSIFRPTILHERTAGTRRRAREQLLPHRSTHCTSVRESERELLTARQRAEDEARTKADLIATVSHDVRAPLSAMAMAIALLEKLSPTSQQIKYIRVLQSSTSRALSLVDNLLDLSRLEAGRTALREERFSLRGLVDEGRTRGRAAEHESRDHRARRRDRARRSHRRSRAKRAGAGGPDDQRREIHGAGLRHARRVRARSGNRTRRGRRLRHRYRNRDSARSFAATLRAVRAGDRGHREKYGARVSGSDFVARFFGCMARLERDEHARSGNHVLIHPDAEASRDSVVCVGQDLADCRCVAIDAQVAATRHGQIAE